MYDIGLNRDSFCISIKEGRYNLDEFSCYEGGSIQILIFNEDSIEVGFIDGSMDCNSFHIELIEIYDGYQRMGYGKKAMKTLINICRELEMEYIHGESKNSLKKFYIGLGAVYENREDVDYTFILDKFYIDL